MELELKEGTDVFTPSGEQVGKINRIVLDPTTNEVTHIVVQKGWLLPVDKVVPVAMIASATEDRVVLNKDSNFDQLPPFEERHFVALTQADLSPAGYLTSQDAPAYYWYPPARYMGYPAFGVEYYGWPPAATTRNIPTNVVPLKEGAAIIGSDSKHIGDVERVFIDTQSHRATHFLISQGVLFKERKLVPAHWVRSVEEDQVYLAVPSHLLECLPAYED